MSQDTFDRSSAIGAMLARRSVREYAAGGVDEGTRKLLLLAGMAAPAAHGKKSVRFSPLDDKALRAAIVRDFPWYGAILSADFVVLVSGRPEACAQREYWTVDCSAATENILVAASSLGLGSLWMGIAPVEENMRRFGALVALPEGLLPFSLVAVGVPAKAPAPRDPWDPALIVEAKPAT